MMNTNFSEKLKLLRKNKGITQQALANAIGEKRSIIANYESNNSTPGFEVLNKLSNFFNVPVGYLTGKTNSLVSEYSFKTLEDYIDSVCLAMHISEEKLKEAGISEFETFENYDLEKCVNKIIEYVKK